jgi:thioesterase domain-containing protein
MDTVLYAERLKEFDEDVKWLHTNYNDLVDKFEREFIAIKKQQVIEHDGDVSKLKEKLKQKGIEPLTTLVELIRNKRNQIT